MNVVKIQKKFSLTAIYLFLIGTVFVGASLSIFHFFQDDPLLIDLILPPVMTVFTIVCIRYLYCFPDKGDLVVRLFIQVNAFALCLAAWPFTFLAIISKTVNLTEALPPVTPVFLAITFAMAIFIDADRAKRLVLIIWILYSTPILGYLAFHPQELLSIRGIELLIAIGPIMLMVFALVVIKDVDLQMIEQIAEKLRGVIAANEFYPGLIVTASFGVTMVKMTDSVQLLLKRVDTALYEAKQNGHNRVVVLR